jgi:hypothetical protein
MEEQLIQALNPSIWTPSIRNELNQSDIIQIVSTASIATDGIYACIDGEISVQDMMDRIEYAVGDMDSYLAIAEDNLDFYFGYE